MRTLRWITFGAVVTLSCTLTAWSRAEANDDTARRLLDALRANGTISDEQYDSITASGSDDAVLDRLIDTLRSGGVLDAAAVAAIKGVPADTGADAHAGAGPAPKAPAAPEPPVDDWPPHVEVDRGGLQVSSTDGSRYFELGGRIHVDAGWIDDDGLGVGNGSEVRRVRLEWEGGLGPNWQLKGAVDFAEEEVSLKSTYVRYLGFDPLYIEVGNFKENFSMERLMSSNDTTFMERAAPTTAFAPGRNPGVGVGSSGDNWSAQAGVYMESTDNENQAGINESWATTGRLTFAPINEKTRVVHLGAAGSMRWYDDDDEIDFRERFETHLSDERLVDTGDLTGIDSVGRIGLELAAMYGPFSVQSEYYGTEISRDGAAGDDAYLDGWYAYASWVLTGESRKYKASRGRFGGIKPNREVGNGGAGAWELAARFSRLDLSDEDIDGGRQDILTVGLNWYALSNLRFMANYIDVLDVTGPNAGIEPRVFQIRSALNF